MWRPGGQYNEHKAMANRTTQYFCHDLLSTVAPIFSKTGPEYAKIGGDLSGF